MSSRVYPDDGSRFTYRLDGINIRSAGGAQAVIFTDQAATTRAAIRYHDGSGTPGGLVPNSALTVDDSSQIPLFWGPAGAEVLWTRVSGGPSSPLYPRSRPSQTDVDLALALAIAL